MTDLVAILGDLGSGKTLLLLYYSLLTSRNVWSNFKIEIPTYNKLEITHFAKSDLLPDNIMICIDEIYAWFESRLSGRDLNIAGSHLLFHARKLFSSVFYSSPLFSPIDKRFRLMSNVIITAQPRFDDYDDFNYEYYYTRFNTYAYFTIPYDYAEQFLFQKYNTYEKVESAGRNRLEFNVLRQDPKALLKKIIEIYDELKDQFDGKITHDLVETVLLLNGYYTGYKKYLYLYAKKELTKVKGVIS